MTQCERIVRHIKDHGSITSMEAITEYGILRLASRITDLKSQGIPVKRVMETGKNRYGELVSYARYYMEDRDAEL
jgi:hypothetical protein